MPTLARAHDSVMPLGTMVSMAMSAIGGCWWPLDFEPSWMRAVARALPTTWTMQAYNDLMIRRMTWDAAVRPTLMTLALGLLYVAIGIAANVRVRERRGP
jgi:ABC-2 type transport system permease protein